jgi:hypothetical protein
MNSKPMKKKIMNSKPIYDLSYISSLDREERLKYMAKITQLEKVLDADADEAPIHEEENNK